MAIFKQHDGEENLPTITSLQSGESILKRNPEGGYVLEFEPPDARRVLKHPAMEVVGSTHFYIAVESPALDALLLIIVSLDMGIHTVHLTEELFEQNSSMFQMISSTIQ